jgi:hypothetical protein
LAWENPGIPAILQVLRGDFFCLPFGGNTRSFRGENHPPHGETANARWTCVASAPDRLHLSSAPRFAAAGSISTFGYAPVKPPYTSVTS